MKIEKTTDKIGAMRELEVQETKDRLSHLKLEETIPNRLRQNPQIIGRIGMALDRTSGRNSGLRFVFYDEAEDDSSSNYLHNTQLNFNELKGKKVRPLIYGFFKEEKNDFLLVEQFDVNPNFQGDGSGREFQENLVKIAIEAGFRFLGGENSDSNKEFFLKSGRYLIEEIKEELRDDFSIAKKIKMEPEVYVTIKFLNPDDEAYYIKADRIGTGVESKIDLKKKRICLSKIFANLNSMLRIIESTKENDGLSVPVEILKRLKKLLPMEAQAQISMPSEETEDLLFAKVLLEGLRNKFEALISTATLEQLENIG